MGATVGFAVFLLLALHAVPAVTDSVKTSRPRITDVAEGVYAIRHPDAPDTFPQGNTTVIVGDREVLVVDSCYLPSSAREDIARIRQWTRSRCATWSTRTGITTTPWETARTSTPFPG